MMGFGRRRLQIRRANVLEILSGPGDFTFFAPTNRAFASLPQELLELLYLRDAFIPHLEDLLRYHALNGKRFTDQFFAIEIIPAFNSEGLLVREDPFLVNGIRIVRSNIEASNGVTHVINGVLKPDWVDNSILSFVTNMDDLSILFELLERADLNDKLDTFGDEFTLVAPTNDAFTALGVDVLDSLRDPEKQQTLFNILEYHIITGVFAELEVGANLPTEQGGSIDVSITEVANTIDFMVNQATVVSSGSILANNGALYKVDAVLNPDSVAGF
jgi:transforming growth factor-beta-induced protein